MTRLEREVDRIINLLRSKIKERGYTQLRIQNELGWGHNYVSRIMTGNKPLRMKDLLLILNIIKVEPADFFSELYTPEKEARRERPAPQYHNERRAAPVAPDNPILHARSWTSNPIYNSHIS